MAEIPIAYPSTPANAIATYNYVDIADGTGVQDFYLMRLDNAVRGLQPQQTRTTAKEEEMSAVYVGTGTTFNLSGSTAQTFSLGAFNAQRTIKGTGLVQGSYELSGGSSQGFIKLVFAFTKNGTEFASGSTAQQSATAGSFTSGSLVLPITISTPEHFARGDILGVKYYVLGRGNDDGVNIGVKTTIGTSPLDEDGSVLTPSTNAGETTITKISVPFRLDDVA